MPSRNAAFPTILTVLAGILTAAATAWGGEPQPIRLAESPQLSPDGTRLAFAYRGDVWISSSEGGSAQRLTAHTADDGNPMFSPDGKQLAFVSNRTGSSQVYVMDLEGGQPRQLTRHSEGYQIDDWYPDGTALLVSAARDHYWRQAARFFPLSLTESRAERPLFDDYGSDGKLSPDGQRLLFVREGERWWRKGYRGSRAAQIWLYDIRSGEFTELLHEETDSRWPLWKPDGQGFYFVRGDDQGFDLWEYDFGGKKKKRSRLAQRTSYDDQSVVFPTLSRDGRVIVFRHLFDFYRLETETAAAPRRIELLDDGDTAIDECERRVVTEASELTITDDGLEMAFVAGGDLWVMDTELKEPQAVTSTAGDESNPTFSPDGNQLYFVSDQEGQTDVWRATRSRTDLYWWQNTSFDLERLTHDAEVEDDLRVAPDGRYLYYVRANGDLMRMELTSKQSQRLVQGFSAPSYNVSPDGKWVAYAQSDNDFNSEIWLIPSDGSAPPYNLSRHPDNDGDPVWSPDGKMLAFVGRRNAEEIDIVYVWLEASQHDKSNRAWRLEKALATMRKARAAGGAKPAAEPTSPGATNAPEPGAAASAAAPAAESGQPKSTEKKLPSVVIDFDGLHERLRHISIPNSRERELFWSPDGKKLAFTADIEGKPGIYSIEFPDNLTPKLLSSTTGSRPRWLQKGNVIVMLASGVPTTMLPTGAATRHTFQAHQECQRSDRYAAAFDVAWRIMGDRWYDDRLNNRNWDDVRRRYREMAAGAPDLSTLSTVIHLMLGELNGSHLGFSLQPARSGSPNTWQETTAHLGVRFDSAYKGPGLRVRDVLPEGPADKSGVELQPNDLILAIDGTAVDPDLDLVPLLTGRLDRDIRLKIRRAKPSSTPAAASPPAPPVETPPAPPLSPSESASDKNSSPASGPAEPKDEEVVVRPISYGAARGLLYEKWLRDNMAYVDEQSNGRMGYLHIRAMDTASFLEFERNIYAVGFDKDGLVIDVRENGGGFTADFLLTVLMQPSHAITVPRGGGVGYPQDRKVYASWNKPIVVLCNQNSYSNAEIFSHAIKGLQRGKLVGVPTAGGVVSTGSARVMDIGILRLPFRGWFVKDTGEDMELNGAVPDIILWPQPGELPRGEDRQLAKAVEVLAADIAEFQSRPQPILRKASERERPLSAPPTQD